MRNSRLRVALALGAAVVTAAVSSSAEAQQQAQGFAVERLYTSAAGGGWFVMDTLDMHGGLGGAANLVASYARNPLRVTDGTTRLAVVSDMAILQLGLAATYDRFRLYTSFDSPLTVRGNGGIVGGYTFSEPQADPEATPDALARGRVGLDARILGKHTSPFRLGLGAQLGIPGGAPGSLRNNYLSDSPPSNTLGAYTAMFRVMVAGDVGPFTYAGHVGVHWRALDDAPTPGSPRGHEGLFGVAAGVRFPMCTACTMRVVVGPEIYGATAFRSFAEPNGTALEGLLTGRLEGTADDGPQMRVKLGAGVGLNHHFGAAEWRLVFAIELFDHSTDRDDDGISDSKDACPDLPGTKTRDPKTNGCPAERGRDRAPDVEHACPDVSDRSPSKPPTNGCAPNGRDQDSSVPEMRTVPSGELHFLDQTRCAP